MARVSESVTPRSLAVVGPLAAALMGALLVLTARAGALALLVAVAIVQAVLAVVWVFGTGLPGRIGALVLAAMAAAGADVTVSLWPRGQLGTLLIVLALAVPAMIVHQLARGAARVRLVDSLGAIALLVVAEVAAPALLQLRHEFVGSTSGGTVVAAAAAAAAGGLVIGYLVDLVVPAPRFDADVPRGLPAVIASTLCGGAIGYLMLRSVTEFLGGRGAVIGAALAAVAAFIAVGMSFTEHSRGRPVSAVGQLLRPMLSAVLPLAILGPVAFIVCLAIRA
jgi:hypothetical protein